MKTLKILAGFCIMLSFGLEFIKAQVPITSSYQTTDKNSSLSVSNPSPSHDWLHTHPLNYTVGQIHAWTDMTKKPRFTFNATGRNYFDLIHSPTLLNLTSTKMSGNLTSMEFYGMTGTFNSKWEGLRGTSLIDTTSIYYYHLKIANKTALWDNHLYRFSGNLFNMVMRYMYPRTDVPLKYPQTPYSPR